MVFLIKDEIAAHSSAGLDAVVDMDDWSARVTIDVIGEAGFGSRFDALTHPFTPLNKGYRSAFVADASSRALLMLSFLTSPTFTNLLPLKRVKAKVDGHRVVRSWIRETIEERKKDMYHNVDDVNYLDRTGHTDIISAVMREGTLNTDGLVEQAMTFLGAGHGKSPLIASTKPKTNTNTETSVPSPPLLSHIPTNPQTVHSPRLGHPRALTTISLSLSTSTPCRNPRQPPIPLLLHPRNSRAPRLPPPTQCHLQRNPTPPRTCHRDRASRTT